ncbi:MAG: hypothetical protein IKY19_08110 [Bacteroidaceae bacterium]|nr:hypothetical protein [Bacteroidaceae bacterium]
MYDSGARWQYSLIPRFSTIDPLAEKYYHLSPYAYCAGDPVNLIDLDGKILLRESVILFAQLSLCCLPFSGSRRCSLHPAHRVH